MVVEEEFNPGKEIERDREKQKRLLPSTKTTTTNKKYVQMSPRRAALLLRGVVSKQIELDIQAKQRAKCALCFPSRHISSWPPSCSSSTCRVTGPHKFCLVLEN